MKWWRYDDTMTIIRWVVCLSGECPTSDADHMMPLWWSYDDSMMIYDDTMTIIRRYDCLSGASPTSNTEHLMPLWSSYDDHMMIIWWYHDYMFNLSGASPTSDAEQPPSHSTFRTATVTGTKWKNHANKLTKLSTITNSQSALSNNISRASCSEESLWKSTIPVLSQR